MWGSTIETIWHKNLPRSLSFLLVVVAAVSVLMPSNALASSTAPA
jgi:hypothetical protein